MGAEAAHGSAIVVGVGPSAGLGAALCRRFAREGLHVVAAGRTERNLEQMAAEIESAGGKATAVVADTTLEADAVRIFDVAGELGRSLELVVYNAGNNMPGNLLEMDAAFFERAWRVGCFGGFLVGREAARRLLPGGRGTVLFTGATASIRGRPPFVAFAAAKAGLRMVAQVMAREYGPRGIHVAHVVIDGGIHGDKIVKGFPQFVEAKGEDGLLGLDAIAEAFWQLHRQHRSAWTHELDLRPFKETF